MAFLGIPQLSQQEQLDLQLLTECNRPGSCNMNIVREALLKGANPNTKGPDAYNKIKSALRRAVEYSLYELTECLIHHGAYVNEQDEHGDTLLHYAVQYYKISMAQILLANGADASIRNNAGLTPLDLLRKNKTFEMIVKLVEKESPSGWHCDKPNEVVLIENNPAIGYSITSIFNFSASRITKLYRNLITNGESNSSLSFEEYQDQEQLAEARKQLAQNWRKEWDF